MTTSRQPLIAFLILLLGMGAAAVLVGFWMSEGEAHAAKVRKKPKDTRAVTQSSGVSAQTTRPPMVRTQLHATCPQEMVNVRGQFCIDRWEASVVDAHTQQPASAYYPPHAGLAQKIQERWVAAYLEEVEEARRWMREAGATPPALLGVWGADPSSWLGLIGAGTMMGSAGADATAFIDAGVATRMEAGVEGGVDASLSMLPSVEAPHGWVMVGENENMRRRAVMMLPPLVPWQADAMFRPIAVSAPGVVPQGFTPGFVADPACREAGKRLCREDEWVLACKGEKGTKFPYGDRYQQGRCNVFRQDHPGLILHGNWSVGLSDPRLNLVRDNAGEMLRNTGSTPSCASVWGQDAIFDMVGNLDEWIDDPAGVFVGGFYARNTRNGCDARVSSHPLVYFDYSTGFRCCADLLDAQQ
jgi:hypothetical protein